MKITIIDEGFQSTYENASECLRCERVVEVVKKDDGTFYIRECCDAYYGVTLSREQFVSWIEELRAML